MIRAVSNVRALAAALVWVGLVLLTGCVETGTYEVGIVHEHEEVPPLHVVSHFPIPPMPGGVQDFSGIATRDGVNIMLLSDHGFVAVARLGRGYGQQIQAMDVRQVVPLSTGAGGQAAPYGGHYAEDLALDSRGRIYIGFEQTSRVDIYERLGSPPQGTGRHSDFDILNHNASFEAVAVDRNGTVYAIPEHAARLTYGFPSYRYQNGEWTGSFRLPQEYHFYPVSADFGPDGMLYVLERERGAQGVRSQVRRFSVQGRAITRPQLVMRTEYNQFGNLEGLAVFRDWSGRIRLLMVSDNDLSPTRPGELLDVLVTRR